jgi:hypothetical protein
MTLIWYPHNTTIQLLNPFLAEPQQVPRHPKGWGATMVFPPDLCPGSGYDRYLFLRQSVSSPPFLSPLSSLLSPLRHKQPCGSSNGNISHQLVTAQPCSFIPTVAILPPIFCISSRLVTLILEALGFVPFRSFHDDTITSPTPTTIEPGGS